MRLSFLLMLLLHLGLYSQTPREIMPLVEENKVWINEKIYCSDYSGNRYYSKFVMKGDTVIGKHVFKKVQVQPYCDSFYFMRETDTFYWYNHSVFSNTPGMAKVGKCVYAIYPGDEYECLLYYWKYSFGPIQHGLRVYRNNSYLFYYNHGDGAIGNNFKTYLPYPLRVEVGYRNYPHALIYDHWLERVGSVENLFYNDPLYFLSFISHQVKCVWKEDTLLYSNLGSGESCMPFVADFTFSDQCLGDTSRISFYCCETIDKVTWDLGDGTLLHWSGNMGQVEHYYENPGDYRIAMTAVSGGDTLKLTKYLVVRDKPNQVDLGSDTVICGTQYLMDSKIQAYKYFWSNGDTSPQTMITQSGTYFLVAGHNSCVVTDTVNIELRRQPDIRLDSMYSFCEGSSIRLDAGQHNYGMNHYWSNGQVSRYSTFFDSGWQSLKIFNGICRDSSSFYIKVHPFESDFLQDTSFFCTEGIDLHAPDVSTIMQIGGVSDTLFHFDKDTVIQVKLIQGACSTNREIVLLENLPKTEFVERDYDYCSGDSLRIEMTLHPQEFLQWMDGDTSRTKRFGPKGRDTVYFQLFTSSCIRKDSIFLVPFDPPTSPFVERVFEKCSGQHKIISLPEGFEYFMNGLPVKDSLVMGQYGEFMVSMIDSNGCKMQDTLLLTETEPYPNRDTSICAILPLWFSKPESYLFIEPGNVREENSQFIFTEPGRYTIYMNDSFSCKTFTTVVLEPDCERMIPNAFSPNNDGLNDLFVPELGHAVFRMIIVDRWGEVVSDMKGQNISWDGIHAGQPCPVGVYFYVIQLDFPAPNPRNLSGSIQLIR